LVAAAAVQAVLVLPGLGLLVVLEELAFLPLLLALL
jgi:hypothetical protein